MTNESATIRVFIPLTFKQRNGRPKILPPENIERLAERRQDPHVLRAIGRAWSWRRKLESGGFSTMSEIAEAEGLSLTFVCRYIRLAYAAPDVLHALVIDQRANALPIAAMADSVKLSWLEQKAAFLADSVY